MKEERESASSVRFPLAPPAPKPIAASTAAAATTPLASFWRAWFQGREREMDGHNVTGTSSA